MNVVRCAACPGGSCIVCRCGIHNLGTFALWKGCTGAAESRQIRLPALSNRSGWRAAASAMFCLLKPRLTWQSHWPAAACTRLPCTWRRA